MIRSLLRTGVVAAALLGVCAQAAAPTVPAAAFAVLPQISDVQLSPDGRLLAWREQAGLDVQVVVCDASSRARRQTLPIESMMTLRSLLWADDSTLLVSVSEVKAGPEGVTPLYTYFRTLALDVATGRTRVLLMSDGARAWVTGSTLIAWKTAVPHTVVMATFDYSSDAARSEASSYGTDPRAASGWVGALFQVDTRTGKGKLIDEGDRYSDQWVVNADGAPVARSEWHPAKSQYVIEARTRAGWQPIFERDDGERLSLYGLGSDGKSVIAAGPDGEGWMTLWAVALDGSGAKDLLPGASADVVDVIADRFSAAPVGVDLGGIGSRIHWLDPAAEARYDAVARAFPAGSVDVYSRSQDGSRVVAEVDDRTHPPVFYLYDFNTQRADVIGEAYPGLDHVTLGAVRSITYAARDGTVIPAYLTLPPGRAPKDLPMVVLPHGGPESHDIPDFDWLAQFLAVRGYAVLQPEFRGSTGFGEAFRLAGRAQWGGRMQDDVTDGVKAMIRQGIADRRRICIVGASYGGYAALAGAAFTPDLYACAVSINGVSDLPALLRYEKAHSGSRPDTVIYWKEEIGSPFDSKVIDRSPVNAAAAIDAPVLLLHAVDDTIVPIAQSQEMASALAALGKSVSLVKLEGEDHWLSNAATRREVLEDTDRFLRRYLQ